MLASERAASELAAPERAGLDEADVGEAFSFARVAGARSASVPTDLGLRRLRGEDVPDAIVGYANESPDGTKMKSSSLAIRDDEGALIGALCLNLDISYFEQYGKFVQRLVSTHESAHIDDGEDFGATSPAEDIRDAIDQVCISHGWMGRSLSNDQKRTVVEFLYRQGHFKKRGAVTIIAEQLGLTRPSIYNYKNDYVERKKSQESGAESGVKAVEENAA